MEKMAALFVFLAGCSTAPAGTLGETCQARADCRAGLACIRARCMPASPGLSVTGRSCFAVECAADADCCASFVPDPSCDFYQMRCTGTPPDCSAFNALCVCNFRCQNELCVDVGPACTTDTDCPGFDRPYCVAPSCVECRTHADCFATGARCEAGVCAQGCDRNEQCPLLHSCQAGTCVASGCTSDRECAFVLGDGRARCVSSACTIGCSDDAECDVSLFEVCSQGACTFGRCSSDEECRAFLHLENVRGPTHAVCR